MIESDRLVIEDWYDRYRGDRGWSDGGVKVK